VLGEVGEDFTKEDLGEVNAGALLATWPAFVAGQEAASGLVAAIVGARLVRSKFSDRHCMLPVLLRLPGERRWLDLAGDGLPDYLGDRNASLFSRGTQRAQEVIARSKGYEAVHRWGFVKQF
jgi:hypothetical protein